VVRIPTIAEDEQHRAETVFGRQCFGRRGGEVLHPERRPPLMLEQIRRTLGEYNFAGQYQQSPSPMGGGMVKAVWFRGYAPNERTEEFDHVCRAGTAHVLRKRMGYPELKRGICEQCEAFNASVVLIEHKASGTQLIQELVEPSLHAVTRYPPQSDKIMRMHAQTAMIENGFVYLPKDAGWLAEYLHELTVFPKGSTTTRSTRRHKCSTGSSAAAAPAPTRGSTSCIKSSPSRRARRRRSPHRYRRCSPFSSGGDNAAATRQRGRSI
jgi:predicted phage terminase large subunit-like protein